MTEQAEIHAVSPEGYPVSVTVSGETTKEVFSRVRTMIEHLDSNGYQPPVPQAAPAAGEKKETKADDKIKPGDDYTILKESSTRLVRIFNPLMPTQEQRQQLFDVFKEIMGERKAILVKKGETKYKSHWTVNVGFYHDILDHPYFSGYEFFEE